MKKICIIVDPMSTSIYLPGALRSYGYTVVGIFTQGKKYCGIKNRSPRDLDLSIYETGMEWPEQVNEHNVRFILPGADSGLYFSDHLSNLISLDSANDYVTSSARRDKYQMIEQIRRAGLTRIRQAQCQSVQEVERFLNSFRIDHSVVKPLEGMGSDQVWICDDISLALTAASNIFNTKNIFGETNTRVLVQEFIAGDEYMIDTISVQGQHKIVSMWASYLGTEMSPVPLHADAIDDAHEMYEGLRVYCQQVLDALGVKYGASHIEVKFNPKDSCFNLIELNPRFHGSMDLLFATTIYGNNQVSELAASIADPERYLMSIHHSPKLKAHGRKVYLRSSVQGVAVKNLDESHFSSLTSFTSLSSRVKLGAMIRKTESLSTSPGTVFLCNRDARGLTLDFNYIRQNEASIMADLLVLTEDSNETLV